MRQREMHVNPLWQQYEPCVLVDRKIIFFVRKIKKTTGVCVSLLSIGDIPRLHIMNNDKNQNRNKFSIGFHLFHSD